MERRAAVGPGMDSSTNTRYSASNVHSGQASRTLKMASYAENPFATIKCAAAREPGPEKRGSPTITAPREAANSRSKPSVFSTHMGSST
eukprot:CAMPEP_0182832974 /NCGR_PEP_ID=MMETSP0006_2-20121128/20020_1 /TAXON_ID=97485 /ORGANISM="Prymnesium parvum, Strain Texoma1" /LENGTH=88 /DNA_ID=CAMNT_0024960895 /DNA_START=122 /DNA_END=384 /DNA_ORIENTATION=+